MKVYFRKICFCVTYPACILFFLSCGIYKNQNPIKEYVEYELGISSSNEDLVEAFNWAKMKAKSYVQTGKKGPINVWENGKGSGQQNYIPSYWAGYPGRSAFYSRDFCHQAIGASILGLHEENFAMIKAFSSSASESKKWFPLWAINFDGSPFVIDYKNDNNFVREIPASFELVQKALEIYMWTGDKRYIQDETLWNFYTKTVTEFIELHDLQIPNGIAEGTGEGIFQGTSTYNEQKDFPLIESGDGIASQYQAFLAYSKIAKIRGENTIASTFENKAEALKNFFNQNWGVTNTSLYNRGYLLNGKNVDGWGKENSWFLPMKGITNGGSQRTLSYLSFINEKLKSKDDIPDNIEALSYIPETFFAHHQNEIAWKWMKHIIVNLNNDHSYQSATGSNGDYPEVSYVLIQNIIKDLGGISPNIAENSISTCSHLPHEIEDLKVQNLSIGKTILTIQHIGNHTSKLDYQKGDHPLIWEARFEEVTEHLFVNGVKTKCLQITDQGVLYSVISVELQPKSQNIISIH